MAARRGDPLLLERALMRRPGVGVNRRGGGLRGFGGGGAPRLTPASFASLFARYRARAGEVTLNGSNVSEWDDLVGDDQSLLQGTAAQQPAFTASDANLNNKGSIRPDVAGGGLNDHLNDNTAADWKCLHNGTGFTAIVIWYPIAEGDPLQTLYDTRRGANTSIGGSLLRGRDLGSASYTVSDGTSAILSLSGTNGSSPAAAINGWVVRYREGGIPGLSVEGSLRVNGVSVATADSTAAPSAADPTDPLTVFNRSDGAAGNRSGSKWTEFCFFNAALTDSEIAALSRDYFVPEYGRSI